MLQVEISNENTPHIEDDHPSSSPQTSLANYDSMVSAIERCYRVDEVKDIRDQAMAFEYYARQACNVEAEQKAIEIRVRAERQAGKLLREMQRAPRGGDRKSDEFQNQSVHAEPIDSEYAQAKTDANISDSQAKRWQKLADIPQEEFEEKLADPLVKPSTSGLIEEAKRKAGVSDDQADHWERLAEWPHQGGIGESEPPIIEQEKTLTPEEYITAQASDEALWFWSPLLDLEGKGYLEKDINKLFQNMPPVLQDDVERIAPRLAAWLNKLEVENHG